MYLKDEAALKLECEKNIIIETKLHYAELLVNKFLHDVNNPLTMDEVNILRTAANTGVEHTISQMYKTYGDLRQIDERTLDIAIFGNVRNHIVSEFDKIMAHKNSADKLKHSVFSKESDTRLLSPKKENIII